MFNEELIPSTPYETKLLLLKHHLKKKYLESNKPVGTFNLLDLDRYYAA